MNSGTSDGAMTGDRRLEVAASNENPTAPLRPFCNECGWRKGGRDSWDGHACKCDHSEPPTRDVEERPANESTPQTEQRAPLLQWKGHHLWLGGLWIGEVMNWRRSANLNWRGWLMSEEDGEETGWYATEEEAKSAVWDAAADALGSPAMAQPLVEEAIVPPPSSYDEMREALRAVDELWARDADLGFKEEMGLGTPVGNVWAKVRAALAKVQP